MPSNASAWSNWENLGGEVADSPSCVTWGPGRLDCFVRGPDNTLRHIAWSVNGWWGAWVNLGGEAADSPSCVTWGPVRLDCFVRGPDNTLRHIAWPVNGWWGIWVNLGDNLLNAPRCASSGPGRLDCFVRNANGAMHHRWWPLVREVGVRHYTTASITNADADGILANVSAALQANDGPGDVACDITYRRIGNVTAFSDGDGSVDSQEELDALLHLPGEVKVVNAINFCGFLNPGFAGCGRTPGDRIVVERTASDLIWAHELGHNRGLNHRAPADVNAIMNATVTPTSRRVNAFECDQYRATPAPTVMAAGSEPRLQPAGGANKTTGPILDVKDFVRQTFVHAVPYAEATRYGGDVVPILLAMLEDRQEQASWHNIVVVLGMIGDQRAVEPMITFIYSSGQEHDRARRNAIFSLGYLLNKNGDERVLRFLTKGLSPESWRARVQDLARPQVEMDERSQDFSKYAILGLTVSGRPEAAAALRSLRQKTSQADSRSFEARVGDLVSSSLRARPQVS